MNPSHAAAFLTCRYCNSASVIVNCIALGLLTHTTISAFIASLPTGTQTPKCSQSSQRSQRSQHKHHHLITRLPIHRYCTASLRQTVSRLWPVSVERPLSMESLPHFWESFARSQWKIAGNFCWKSVKVIFEGATRNGSKAAHLHCATEDEVVTCCKDLIHEGELLVLLKYGAAQRW
jgi:hypothetical protein